MSKDKSGERRPPVPGSDEWKLHRYLSTHSGVERMLDQAADFERQGCPAEALRLVEAASVLTDWLSDRRESARILPSSSYAGLWENESGVQLEIRADGTGRYSARGEVVELLEWSAQGQRVAITGRLADNYGQTARTVLAFVHRLADETLVGPFLWAPDAEDMTAIQLELPLSRQGADG